ncbi:MAG: hypothetical protein LH613_14840 [Chamaesiphon sp.]|nr:hypothetical protein [Chamaesiphon sp.]
MDIRSIQELNSKLTLTLDNPKSVKLQVKQIALAQKQLRTIKKEVNIAIRTINQAANQSYPDSVLSVGLDIFGKSRLAGTIRSETRRQIERHKIDARQPYLDMKDWIDRLILEGDRLKLIAEEYILSN